MSDEINKQLIDLISSKLDNDTFIRTELKGIHDELHSMGVTLGKQSVILDDHTSRSTRSEGRLDLLENEFTKLRGFFFYGSMILGAVGLFATIFSKYWPFVK